jgi:hypothetical protein
MIWLLEHAEEEETLVPNKPVLINKALKDPEPEKIETLEDTKVRKVPYRWNVTITCNLNIILIKETPNIRTPRFGRSLLERFKITSQESKIPK